MTFLCLGEGVLDTFLTHLPVVVAAAADAVVVVAVVHVMDVVVQWVFELPFVYMLLMLSFKGPLLLLW